MPRARKGEAGPDERELIIYGMIKGDLWSTTGPDYTWQMVSPQITTGPYVEPDDEVLSAPLLTTRRKRAK